MINVKNNFRREETITKRREATATRAIDNEEKRGDGQTEQTKRTCNKDG